MRTGYTGIYASAVLMATDDNVGHMQILDGVLDDSLAAGIGGVYNIGDVSLDEDVSR
jgi:hypothetical protein